ncbi:MAG: hypothetical protein IKS25_07135 [Oscillospiraceae bacterium]|nr:hypothetical protein [Oscillospiraceae bacterium]
MEKKKANLGNAAADAGKAAAGFLGKAKKAVVSAIDQNGDGSFNLEDISAVTDSVKAAAKDTSEKWSETLEKKKREKELAALRPLFELDVEKPDFALPKLIRVAAKDEKHAESDVCKDSIGFVFASKELDVITIYPEKISDFELKFYPDMDSEMYYVDPADRDHYIALDEYFNYLRIARISELQKIAQDLGAKHFRVRYKEQQKTRVANDVKGKSHIKAPGRQGVNTEAEHHRSESSDSEFEIAAEMEYIGHKPVEPTLVYFRKDPQIQSLVSSRMADNVMTRQIYTLDLSNSSGIKMKDAVKIDAAMSAMKIEGNATVTSEVQNEMRRIFEYEIDF